MRPILNYLPFLFFFFTSNSLYAQQAFEKELPAFSKVYISDKIDVLLEEADETAALLTYKNVDQDDIRLEVKGNTLSVYLEGCKKGCDDNRYANANVQLSLSYQHLEKLVVMGDQRVQHLGEIDQEYFVLKAYGESHIQLDEISVYKFKTSLFGDGVLNVRKGVADEIVVKTFGDQQVNLENLYSKRGKIHAFGDSELDLRIDEELSLSLFGDTHIRCEGNPWINRRLVLGEVDFQSL